MDVGQVIRKTHVASATSTISSKLPRRSHAGGNLDREVRMGSVQA